MVERVEAGRLARQMALGRPGIFRQVVRVGDGGEVRGPVAAARDVQADVVRLTEERNVARRRVGELELEVAHLKRELAARSSVREDRGASLSNAERQRRYRERRKALGDEGSQA